VPYVHSVYGDPVDAIISTANRVRADLIVVGNKGMKGVRRVLGSVPNSVMHRAYCSVAIIDTAE
jgi:nucleotide-binding universal stress UspA family protein